MDLDQIRNVAAEYPDVVDRMSARLKEIVEGDRGAVQTPQGGRVNNSKPSIVLIHAESMDGR